MTTETETASSNKTPQEIESSDLAETRMSDSGIKNVEVPKADAQFEDTVEKTVDGETNKKYDVTNCEEEGEKTITVAKADENAITEDMNGDYMAQSGQNASEDDEEDVMWEDDEENSEEDSEEAADDDDEVSEKDAINEDEDEKERAEADYEENAEEDDKEKTEVEKEIAKGNVGEAEEHNKEKVEVNLKNVKKSRGRRGKKEVGEETLKKLDYGDKAGSSRKRKAKKKVESMGMIFICSSKTKADCYKYRVLGLPESKKDMVEKIYTGMRVFLYDVDLKLMYGIYKAAGPGGYNIEPKAFKSQFPSQVRFTVLDDCLPLAEEKFKKIIKENYYTKTKFDCKLNSEQVYRHLDKLVSQTYLDHIP
ncbi:hypothetical protein ACJIZ3_012548 [Penstemon smallii]|uniref:DCD domain-containing protein n=1 Tax=Penstemon smallii TaxID=265156 RepID=A0ABD3UPH6_9LAMI